MKKFLIFTLLFLSLSISSFSNDEKSVINKKEFVGYEIMLMNDGCFHLCAIYDTYMIVYDNSQAHWAGRGIFCCIADFDSFC